MLDRDGTLVDYAGMFLRFIHELHREEGLSAPSRDELLGAAYWEAIVSGELHLGRVRVRDRVDEVVRRHMPYSGLFPGVPAALSALAAQGVRLALVSAWVATDSTTTLLERHGVRQHFTSVLTRDDLAGHESGLDDVAAKAALSRRALAAMGHEAADRLYVVGDSPADMRLGRLLEAVVVGVRTGNGPRLPTTGPDSPDLMLPSAAALAPLLLPKAHDDGSGPLPAQSCEGNVPGPKGADSGPGQLPGVPRG
ncbi:HAD family hydrolase [Streptomyces sp. NPDC091272]|uniref:HAD family hydrolase n=1 Tax=Streptomyces sp. NPDC091272 TaxID=3365981 RepID=UPI00381EC84C